jgi:hypothetical protein
MYAAIWYGWTMNKRQALAAAKRAGIDKSRVSNLENTDQWFITHEPGQCAGEHCVIHNRSDHVMRSFPQLFRWDRGIMERTCPHGTGHPDPDQEEFFEKAFGENAKYEWYHGCDGCCNPESEIFKINEEHRKNRV